MNISGKIIHVLEEQKGQGKNGEWRKQDYVLETTGEYPKKVCFTVWGDRIEQFGIQMGAQLTVEIEIDSREYNGRWYTNVKAWKLDKAQNYSTDGIDQMPAENPPPSPEEAQKEDDLPF